MDRGSEWRVKGDTLSDKTARMEFGITQDEIMRAIHNGRLSYQLNSIYGNPGARSKRWSGKVSALSF